MLLNTRMQAHGSILFKSNNAIFGGGIMMDDRCLVSGISCVCCSCKVAVVSIIKIAASRKQG